MLSGLLECRGKDGTGLALWVREALSTRSGFIGRGESPSSILS